jgi:octaprenyl-diphosphate synthase
MPIKNAIEPDNNAPVNPLERLSGILDDDMRCVNELIIDHMQSDIALIPQLAGYLIASGGKRIRPLLTLACTRLFNNISERPFGLAASVEFIHTATLLHDDVVDGSKERRGKKAANLVFGNQASVLVGDFLFSRAFQLMTADGSLEILRILSDASATISEGEVKQLITTSNMATTMDDYIAVISAKTAALFAAACEIGPVIAEQDKEAQEALRLYGLHLGLSFQIMDDVLDYSANQEKLGKAIGDDFREGKITAPILMALKNANDEERAFWDRCLTKPKEQQEEDLPRAIEILNARNAHSASKELAMHHAQLAKDSLSKIEKSAAYDNALKEILCDIADYTVNREF